ncbi:MAG: DUF1961 family protein [Pseudomonadota bacterium]
MTLSRREAVLMFGASSLIPAACATAGSSAVSNVTEPELLYANPLAKVEDVEGFQLEGSAHVSFDNQRLILENARPPEDGQAANYVFWCPEVFPADVEISWEFQALREPGLCVFFFGASGLVNGQNVSLFDPRLAKREGLYPQYTQSDVSALQISYFRRRFLDEQRLHVSVLRKAPGFELLDRQADPLPSAETMKNAYKMRLRRKGRHIQFFIEDLTVIDWVAPSDLPLPDGGRLGFRQMAPLKAAYSNLKVTTT